MPPATPVVRKNGIRSSCRGVFTPILTMESGENSRASDNAILSAWTVGADRWRTCRQLSRSLQHLGVGFVSLTEALGPDRRPWTDDARGPGHGQRAALLAAFAGCSNGRFCENGCAPAWPTRGRRRPPLLQRLQWYQWSQN